MNGDFHNKVQKSEFPRVLLLKFIEKLANRDARLSTKFPLKESSPKPNAVITTKKISVTII